MGLFGMMRTGVSGLAAQSSKLSTIGDNIANSDTTGYKRADIEFSSMVLHAHGGSYTSGSVGQTVRHGISQQGALEFSTSATDLAISGTGFFLVADEGGRALMTRAGAFVLDGDGQLVNSGGQRLLGYPVDGGAAGAVLNGTAGLVPVSLSDATMRASPSRAGTLAVNLPSTAPTVAVAELPSGNASTASPTAKASVLAYDSLGAEVVLDVFMTKTASQTWELAVFDRATAAPGGTFPYASGPLATETLVFDPANGRLAGASANSVSVAVPGGETLEIDVSNTSQLATDYAVIDVGVDGNSAAGLDRVEFGRDGTLYAVYENGARVPSFKVPLANVASPDRLSTETGTAFSPTIDSGDFQIGFAGDAGLGAIQSGALEASTVDIATELTSMIEAQRTFTANSKVVQTGSELLDVLVNLKR